MDNKNNTKIIHYLDGVMFVGSFSLAAMAAATVVAAATVDASILLITQWRSSLFSGVIFLHAYATFLFCSAS